MTRRCALKFLHDLWFFFVIVNMEDFFVWSDIVELLMMWFIFELTYSGIILCMRPANGRQRYIVTSSVIGWAHTQNDPCLFKSGLDVLLLVLLNSVMVVISDVLLVIHNLIASNFTQLYNFVSFVHRS